MLLPETLPALLAPKVLKGLISSSAGSKFYDKFRIVETSLGDESYEQYKSGHIDKAVYLNTLHCTKPTQYIPYNLPDKACFKDYVGSMGISNKHHLILYDRSPFGLYTSARMWWTFKLFGHEKTSILNGGLRQWSALDYGFSSDLPSFKKESFEVKENKTVIRDFDQVNQIVKQQNEQIVEVRDSPSETIPTAKNVPYSHLFDSNTGGLKNEKQLLELFEQNGVDIKKPIVTSCMRGMTATGVAFAANLVGNRNNSVYYGSWCEYAQRK